VYLLFKNLLSPPPEFNYISTPLRRRSPISSVRRKRRLYYAASYRRVRGPSSSRTRRPSFPNKRLIDAKRVRRAVNSVAVVPFREQFRRLFDRLTRARAVMDGGGIANETDAFRSNGSTFVGKLIADPSRELCTAAPSFVTTL